MLNIGKIFIDLSVLLSIYVNASNISYFLSIKDKLSENEEANLENV